MTLFPNRLMGLRLIADPNLTEFVGLDWSGCRSIPRAMRRAKRGPRFKQRVREIHKPKDDIYKVGDSLIAHPVTLRKVVEEFERQNVESRVCHDRQRPR